MTQFDQKDRRILVRRWLLVIGLVCHIYQYLDLDKQIPVLLY